jgi:hypothetical protein
MTPPSASLSLTPTANTEIAVYAVDLPNSADIPGWFVGGNVIYLAQPRLRANVLYLTASSSGAPQVGTWGTPAGAGWGAVGCIVKAAAGSGIANLLITNPGTVTVEKALIDILGPISNPQIINATTGTSIWFSGNVAAGKHLLIDCGAFTATNDGNNVIGSIGHAGATPFLTLAPGPNALSMHCSAVTGATSITVSFATPFD